MQILQFHLPFLLLLFFILFSSSLLLLLPPPPLGFPSGLVLFSLNNNNNKTLFSILGLTLHFHFTKNETCHGLVVVVVI